MDKNENSQLNTKDSFLSQFSPLDTSSSPLENSKNSFLSQFSPLPPKFQGYQQEAYQAKQEAEKAGSWFGTGGILDKTVEGTTEAISGAVETVATAATQDIPNAVIAGWQDAGSKAATAWQNAFDTHKTALQTGLSAGEAGLAAVNAFFAPVTTALQDAEQLPGVLGATARGVNSLFSTIGEGASKVMTDGIIQNLPISQETKDQVKPLAGELASLASQILVGEVGAKGFKKAGELTADLNSKIQFDITSKKIEPKQPTPTIPGSKEEFLSKFSPVESTAIPIDQTIHPQATGGILGPKVEPIIPVESIVSKEIPTIKTEEFRPVQPNEIIPKEFTTKMDLETGEQITNAPQKGISKVAESVQTKAVEQGLAEGFKDIAGYDKVTIKDQSTRAADLMATRMEDAKKMITGEMPIESGLRPEMLFKAMEDHAFKTKDIQLIQDLVNSPIASESSVHAQAMRLLQERNPDSAVAQLSEVKKAREAAVVKKTKKSVEQVKSDTVKELKKAKDSVKPTKQTWQDFVNEIKCNY